MHRFYLIHRKDIGGEYIWTFLYVVDSFKPKVHMKSYVMVPPSNLPHNPQRDWGIRIYNEGRFIRETRFETEMGCLYFIVKRIRALSSNYVRLKVKNRRIVRDED